MRLLTDMAGDLETSTAQVLTALRIVATRAGVQELAEWAAKEIEGYDNDDELPPHRTWKLSIVATLHNPMQGVVHNAHLGDVAVAENLRERVTTFQCRQGVGDIERTLANSNNGTFGTNQPNLAMLINTGPMANNAWTCTHASAQFGDAHLQEVVTRARQTALRLCLECEQKGVELQWGGGEGTSPEEHTRWLDSLKEKGTRAIVRVVTESVLAMWG